MADYHIYLHSSGGGNNENESPAKPRNFNKQTYNMDAAKPWQQAAQFVSNPDSLIGVAKQKAMTTVKDSELAQAIPFVAIAMAAAKIIDAAITTGTQLADLYTGSDRTRKWNNFKQPFQWIMNPITTTFSAWTTTVKINKENVRKQLNTQLLGDSQLNTNYKKGV